MAQPSGFVINPSEQDPSEIVPLDPMVDPMSLPNMIDRRVSLGLAPISGVNVGAAGLGFASAIFLGLNIELPGLPLHHSIHAVQFLVTKLTLHSQRYLRYLAITDDNSIFDAPCGHCLQFLEEIRDASNIKILIKNQERNEYVTLESLLPRHVNNRLPKDYPRLLQFRYNGLTFLDPDSTKELCKETDDHEGCDNLKCRALAAANKSYAPYSKCPSGVALMDCDGIVYRGWYLETVAFNPSMGPVQAALVDFVAINIEGKGFDKIVKAVLVEKKDGMVRQEETARMILEKITQRNCVLEVIHCSEPSKPKE